MPFQMGWHKEARILKVLVCDSVSLSETISLDQALTQYLNGAHQPVHILFDVSLVNTFPTSLVEIQDLLNSFNHPQLGWIAFIDGGGQSNPLLYVASQLLGEKYRVFTHLKMGLDFLKAQDPSLAWVATGSLSSSKFANAQPSGSVQPHA